MDTVFYGIGLVPLLVGLVEAVKRAGLPSKFAPVVSVFLGVVLGSMVYPDPTQAILVGAMNGLGACGLYSGGKALLE